MFAICIFDSNDNCLEVTTRKVKEVDYLVQHINENYGGFIIPIIDKQNYFVGKTSEEIMYGNIKEYLN